jgi:hypothetical protein
MMLSRLYAFRGRGDTRWASALGLSLAHRDCKSGDRRILSRLYAHNGRGETSAFVPVLSIRLVLIFGGAILSLLCAITGTAAPTTWDVRGYCFVTFLSDSESIYI